MVLRHPRSFAARERSEGSAKSGYLYLYPCSLFLASLQTFCLTVRAYLNKQKYGLLSLHFSQSDANCEVSLNMIFNILTQITLIFTIKGVALSRLFEREIFWNSDMAYCIIS